MVHVNPFKKKIVAVPNKGTGDTIEKEEHMSWEDAAKVSCILALTQVFIGFLTLYDLSKIMIDPASFCFDLFKFAGASFFGAFIALTGLAKYFSK